MPSVYHKKAVTTAKTAAQNSHLFPEVTLEEAIPDRTFESWQKVATDYFLALPDNGVMTINSPRQHGKSYWLQSAAVWCAVNHPETTTVIVSPVNSQNGRMYEDIKYMLYEDERVDKFLGLPEMQVIFKNGSKIIFKSAETKDRLRGFTAHYLFVDEAAYILEEVYSIILPYLNVTKGRLILTSTPRYKAGWFYTNWAKGGEATDEHFVTLNVTDYDESFFITEDQKRQYKEMLPPSAYKTEIEGLFLDNNEGLFGDYAACITTNIGDSAPVWGGIDWAAKGKDQTVLTALNAAGEVCEIKTWKAKDAVSQVAEIAEWIKDHPTLIKVIVEDNSIGSIYYDMLRQEIPNPACLATFTTLSRSKRELVDNLAALIGRKAIRFPDDPTLTKQLSLFTATLTDTGRVAYAGANGSHDDYVMSLAFAAWNIRVNKANYAISII